MAAAGAPNRIPTLPPRPNYNVQWGLDLSKTHAKVSCVAYVIRANRDGRVTMAGILPSTGGALWGFIGKVGGSGAVATQVNGVKVVQYENDAAPDAGTVQATPDLGLGGPLDVWMGDPANTGTQVVESTSGGANVPIDYPVTALEAAGPEFGPVQGKDAINVSAGDLIAIIVMNPTTGGTGIFQAEIVAHPWAPGVS